MAYHIIFYETHRGENLVKEFICSLKSERVIAKILAYIEYLSIYGPAARRPYVDYLKDKIYELRPSFGHLEIRMLFFYDSKDIVLTHAFLKKTREVPEGHIIKAKEIMKDYMGRR